MGDGERQGGKEVGREGEELKSGMWEGVGFATTGGGISLKPEESHFLWNERDTVEGR